MSLFERDSVLTTDEAIHSENLQTHHFEYIQAGRLKAIKAGKGYRILQSELYRFLNGKTEFGEVQ